MAEHFGDVRAGYEIDRLTSLAADLGLVRTEDFPPQRTAPGTVDADVQRYAELAEELGLSGSSNPARSLPSLGR